MATQRLDAQRVEIQEKFRWHTEPSGSTELALLQGMFESVSRPMKPGRHKPHVLATLLQGYLLMVLQAVATVQSGLLRVTEYALTSCVVRVGSPAVVAVDRVEMADDPKLIKLVAGVTVAAAVAFP